MDHRPADAAAGPTERSHAGVRRPRRRRVLGIVALVLVAVLAAPSWSYAAALTAPGSAAWTTRTVDWLRDHGASPVVDAVENWWFSIHPPADVAPPATQLPEATGPAAGPRPARSTTLPVLTGAYPDHLLPEENVWQTRRVGRHGGVLLASAFIRPDPKHAGVVAGVVGMPQPGVAAHLVAGTTMPGGPSWPGHADVPRSDIPALVATFNSGWRTKDITGGFRLGGQTWPALQDGQATAVIDRDGRLDVGAWGRDFGARSDVVAARQNLALVVDAGAAVPGLDSNLGHSWGYRDNQHQFTYRSGLGVDRHGDIIYVAGAKMTLSVLASAMVDAGVVRGMQLDVHNSFPFLAIWTHQDGSDQATKLLPTMAHGADRYLSPDQRDFFYVTASGSSAP